MISDKFLRRDSPRKIIQGIIVHHEFDWVEVRIRQLSDVVDVFVIMESNITSGNLQYYKIIKACFP